MFRPSRLLFALALIVVASTARTQSADVQPHLSLAFIVNAENPLTDTSLADLRRMLRGEVTRWPNGRKVTVAMREPGQPERDAVLRLICRMSEPDFTRYLLQATFRG